MYRVLVIDDEKSLVDLLQEILVCLGYAVRTACEAREGMRLFDREVFDFVVTDIVMPDMDGHAVARHIRKSKRPYVPIVGISGTPWLLEDGNFDYFLPKPFGIKDLDRALKKVKINNFITQAAS
jgi:CheY-like chemotaxis protein